MDRSRIAIVIPAYNEVNTIRRVVREALLHGTPIVVDDASNDGTGDVAEKEGALVVRHKKNRGYDGALNSGFAMASDSGFNYVITLDADGQHNPALIQQYVALLRDSADLVVGIRPTKARMSERIFGIITTLLYNIRDPLCGMKGYRMSLYQKLGHFDSYNSIGTELTLYAAKHKYKIVQVDVSIGARDSGTPRFGRFFWANWIILRALIIGLMAKKR